VLLIKNNQPQLRAESALGFTLRQRATVKKARVPDTSPYSAIRIGSRITSRIACAVVSLPQSRSRIKECGMEMYAADVKRKMQRFIGWLLEKDRHWYVAVEAARLGNGWV
jgi:hypothetical protein